MNEILPARSLFPGTLNKSLSEPSLFDPDTSKNVFRKTDSTFMQQQEEEEESRKFLEKLAQFEEANEDDDEEEEDILKNWDKNLHNKASKRDHPFREAVVRNNEAVKEEENDDEEEQEEPLRRSRCRSRDSSNLRARSRSGSQRRRPDPKVRANKDSKRSPRRNSNDQSPTMGSSKDRSPRRGEHNIKSQRRSPKPEPGTVDTSQSMRRVPSTSRLQRSESTRVKGRSPLRESAVATSESSRHRLRGNRGSTTDRSPMREPSNRQIKSRSPSLGVDSAATEASGSRHRSRGNRGSTTDRSPMREPSNRRIQSRSPSLGFDSAATDASGSRHRSRGNRGSTTDRSPMREPSNRRIQSRSPSLGVDRTDSSDAYERSRSRRDLSTLESSRHSNSGGDLHESSWHSKTREPRHTKRDMFVNDEYNDGSHKHTLQRTHSGLGGDSRHDQYRSEVGDSRNNSTGSSKARQAAITASIRSSSSSTEIDRLMEPSLQRMLTEEKRSVSVSMDLSNSTSGSKGNKKDLLEISQAASVLRGFAANSTYRTTTPSRKMSKSLLYQLDAEDEIERQPKTPHYPSNSLMNAEGEMGARQPKTPRVPSKSMLGAETSEREARQPKTPRVPSKSMIGAETEMGAMHPKTPRVPSKSMMNAEAEKTPRHPKTPRVPSKSMMNAGLEKTPRHPKTPRVPSKSMMSAEGEKTPRHPKTPRVSSRSMMSAESEKTPRHPKTPRVSSRTMMSAEAERTPRHPKTPRIHSKSMMGAEAEGARHHPKTPRATAASSLMQAVDGATDRPRHPKTPRTIRRTNSNVGNNEDDIGHDAVTKTPRALRRTNSNLGSSTTATPRALRRANSNLGSSTTETPRGLRRTNSNLGSSEPSQNGSSHDATARTRRTIRRVNSNIEGTQAPDDDMVHGGTAESHGFDGLGSKYQSDGNLQSLALQVDRAQSHATRRTIKPTRSEGNVRELLPSGSDRDGSRRHDDRHGHSSTKRPTIKRNQSTGSLFDQDAVPAQPNDAHLAPQRRLTRTYSDNTIQNHEANTLHAELSGGEPKSRIKRSPRQFQSEGNLQELGKSEAQRSHRRKPRRTESQTEGGLAKPRAAVPNPRSVVRRPHRQREGTTEVYPTKQQPLRKRSGAKPSARVGNQQIVQALEAQSKIFEDQDLDFDEENWNESKEDGSSRVEQKNSMTMQDGSSTSQSDSGPSKAKKKHQGRRTSFQSFITSKLGASMKFKSVDEEEENLNPSS